MTREEAINYNKNLREYMKITDKKSEYKFRQENYDALDMAIEALEQEPTEFEEIDFVQEHKKIPVTLDLIPCEDAISRQAAMDCLTEIGLTKFDLIARNKIKNLPPVTPQPEKICIASIHFDEEKLKEICKNAALTILDNSNTPIMQSKMGRWITHPKGIYAHLVCDRCLSRAPYDCHTKYCPNCGQKMAKEVKE